MQVENMLKESEDDADQSTPQTPPLNYNHTTIELGISASNDPFGEEENQGKLLRFGASRVRSIVVVVAVCKLAKQSILQLAARQTI